MKLLIPESNEKKLRYWLWLKYGHSEFLYGDDGEMQCSKCMLDFKRDNIERIEQVFRKQAEEDFWNFCIKMQRDLLFQNFDKLRESLK